MYDKKEAFMKRMLLDEDIQSVTDFRANITHYINKLKETKRPLALTQHGKCSAVVIEAAEYDKLMNELELLKEIYTARQELEEGKGISNDDALARLEGLLNR